MRTRTLLQVNFLYWYAIPCTKLASSSTTTSTTTTFGSSSPSHYCTTTSHDHITQALPPSGDFSGTSRKRRPTCIYGLQKNVHISPRKKKRMTTTLLLRCCDIIKCCWLSSAPLSLLAILEEMVIINICAYHHNIFQLGLSYRSSSSFWWGC